MGGGDDARGRKCKEGRAQTCLRASQLLILPKSAEDCSQERLSSSQVLSQVLPRSLATKYWWLHTQNPQHQRRAGSHIQK